MARTIDVIKKLMTDIFLDNETIQEAYQLVPGNSFDDEFSGASIESILFDVQAQGISQHEQIFDTFKSDVTTYIANMKPGSPQWYANMFLAYQHGFALLPDSDRYDNTGYMDNQIAASKVIAYSAVQEETNTYGRVSLRIKLAGTNGTDLQKLPDEVLAGAVEYGKRIKYAGVPLDVTSGDPDSLRMNWTIYYDPLVLNNSGNRLDGTAQDVITTAIKNYLLALPFNGTFVTEYLQDAVEAVSGVVIAVPTLVQSKYADFDWSDINVMYLPDSGYLRFATDTDLVITYVAQSPIR